MPRIEIRNEQRQRALHRRAIRDLAGFVLGEEGAPAGELSLLFTDNAGIRALNYCWLKRDRPTDVMAFPPQREGRKEPARFLGDVAVSVERAVEQAGRFRQSPAEELALCLVHGILHLFGHADHPPLRRRAMARRERELLRRWKATRDLVHARCRPALRAGGQAAASQKRPTSRGTCIARRAIAGRRASAWSLIK